jgi:hypothetical protein
MPLRAVRFLVLFLAYQTEALITSRCLEAALDKRMPVSALSLLVIPGG